MIATGPLADERKTGRAVEAAFAILDGLAKATPKYRRRFGVTPRFRIAVHGGAVNAGECGEIRPAPTSCPTSFFPSVPVACTRSGCDSFLLSVSRQHRAEPIHGIPQVVQMSAAIAAHRLSGDPGAGDARSCRPGLLACWRQRRWQDRVPGNAARHAIPADTRPPNPSARRVFDYAATNGDRRARAPRVSL